MNNWSIALLLSACALLLASVLFPSYKEDQLEGSDGPPRLLVSRVLAKVGVLLAVIAILIECFS